MVTNNFVSLFHNMAYNTFFTLKHCKETAKKYTKKTDFSKKDSKVFIFCMREGIIDKVCSHMTLSRSKLYTKKQCIKYALTLSTLGELKKSCIYFSCLKLNIVDDILLIINSNKKEISRYEKYAIIASDFNSLTDFFYFKPLIFKECIFSKYDVFTKFIKKLNIDICWAESLLYKNISEFYNNNSEIYLAACIFGIIDEIELYLIDIERVKAIQIIKNIKVPKAPSLSN